MAMLGLSLILASVVYVTLRPPSWLPPWALAWRRSVGRALMGSQHKELQDGPSTVLHNESGETSKANTRDTSRTPIVSTQNSSVVSETETSRRKTDSICMPPPPIPIIQPPEEDEPEEQTTPKATVPTLYTPDPEPLPKFSSFSSDTPASSQMPPPPPPNRRQPPSASRPPTLPQFPAANSAQRARGPLPNRGPPSTNASTGGGGGLAPPPTLSAKPSKPSRQVLLEPGHSPLDWARISSGSADLRGVPSSTPYLKVTPSMLKPQNGRKGRDAWMVLNGKVYNVTPYAKFHPGGVPEMMRGAGKDGTTLFGEVHPWVNYETMLQACLVGLLVDEPTGRGEKSVMEQMD